MRKLKVLIFSVIMLLTMSLPVYATSEYVINDIDTFKEALTEVVSSSIDTNDSLNLTERETELLSITNPEVIGEFLDEKTVDAKEALNSMEIDFNLVNGVYSYEDSIDIGDGCQVSIQLSDRPEVLAEASEIMSRDYSGHTTVWVPYGNRIYTSTVEVQYGLAYAEYVLENYYTASANGVTLRYGIPSYQWGGLIDVSSSDSAVITKGSATTIGSTASMYANYYVTYGVDPIEWGASYKMTSSIKFLQNDYVEDEIHITASYDFS